MIEYTTIIIGNSALCIATTTTIPSGETTTTTIPYNSSTTTTTPGGGQCPAKTVMGQDNPDLKTLRAFRNEMFIQSAVGKRYTTLYYKHAFELADIFSHDPALRAKAGNLIQKFMPVIGNLLVKKEAAISEDTLQKASALINVLTAQASPSFQPDLFRLKQDIEHGIIFKTFGVMFQRN